MSVPEFASFTFRPAGGQWDIIDACFLCCVGCLMSGIVSKEAVVQIDTLKLHRKYSKIFHMDDGPESKRKETAQRTADQILVMLNSEDTSVAESTCGCSA